MYLQAKTNLSISPAQIPELCELSTTLRRTYHFGLAPIEDLIETRAFLSKLGRRTMFCTQYIRQASKPEYTPEPDIVHEVIGHVSMFTSRDLFDFTILLCQAA